MTEEKKQTKTKRLRRVVTTGHKQHTIFELLCLAIATEKWQGAAMLFDLHEFKGNINDIEYELRNLANGLNAHGDNPPSGGEKK
jgi:hypothetical protein